MRRQLIGYGLGICALAIGAMAYGQSAPPVAPLHGAAGTNNPLAGGTTGTPYAGNTTGTGTGIYPAGAGGFAATGVLQSNTNATLGFTGGSLGAGLASNGWGTGILGSPHDFSQANTGGPTAMSAWNPTNEICVVCHIPHGANTAAIGITGNYAPLWNRAVDNTGFTMYTSKLMAANTGTAPTGVSLLCLSCHDGRVGLDQFGSPDPDGSGQASGDVWQANSGATAQTMDQAAPWAKLGTDLTNDHPISFTYQTAITNFQANGMDPQLTIPNGDFVTGAFGTLPLYGGELQCATCHAVHNKDAFGNKMGWYLTRIDNRAQSQLCRNCHTK